VRKRPKELSLLDLLELLFRCHRSAPFLFFNGNTFAEVARRTVDLLFADLPLRAGVKRLLWPLTSWLESAIVI